MQTTDELAESRRLPGDDAVQSPVVQDSRSGISIERKAGFKESLILASKCVLKW